jgi:arylsulfatase A-like enzyme
MDNIGVVFKKLEDMGQFDNTRVVFTTDNGMCRRVPGLGRPQLLRIRADTVASGRRPG